MYKEKESERLAFEEILKRDDADSAFEFLKDSKLSRDVGLARACELCAEQVVERLLADGADPNASLPPSLVRAIEGGCHAILDPLLEAGADLGSDPWREDGDHPLTSAAGMADPVAMRWLCEKGAVDIADPQWLWASSVLLGSSRKKSASEALVVFGQRLLERIQADAIKIETSPLKKAADKLKRAGKKNPDARSLAASLAELLDEMDAEDSEILELTDANRFDDLLSFVRAGGDAKRSRRAGRALLWAVSDELWEKRETSGKEERVVPDPAGISYIEKLFELDPDVDLTDDMGRTALMYAVWAENTEVADWLIELGADLNAIDSESDRSVLGWARASANPEEMAAWVEQAIERRELGEKE